MVEPHLSRPVARRPRRVALAVVAALLWSTALVGGVAGGVGLVRAEQAAVAEPGQEPWSYPPRIVGRADAEVLDVDRADGTVVLDVAFVGPGREPTVTWVDAGHLDEVPGVGATVAVAFVPFDTEIAFEVDDPGLADPGDNGFRAYDTPAPPEPSTGPWVTTLVVAGLVLLGAAGTTLARTGAAPRTARDHATAA